VRDPARRAANKEHCRGKGQPKRKARYQTTPPWGCRHAVLKEKIINNHCHEKKLVKTKRTENKND
jgi:hypothetical protein